MTSKQGAMKATKERDPLLLANGSTKINEGAAKRALKQYGVDVPKKASALELVELLRSMLSAKLADLPKTSVMVCDDCGESSTEETSFCPFCGVEGEAGDDAESKGDIVEDAGQFLARAKEQEAKMEPTTKDAIAARERELDEKMAKIAELAVDMKGNSWDLGHTIKEIFDGELWKARRKERGTPAYVSFAEFLKEELDLGFGKTMVYRLMDLAKQFDRETFVKIGHSKLSIVAEIRDNEEAKAAALAIAAEAEGTKRAVARVRDAAKKSAPTPAKREPAPAKKSDQITLLARVNSKAELHGWRSATSGRPIKVHSEDSYVEVAISEDVVQHICLKHDREGNLIGLTVRFVRSE